MSPAEMTVAGLSHDPTTLALVGLALIVLGSAWAGWSLARRVTRYMLGGRP